MTTLDDIKDLVIKKETMKATEDSYNLLQRVRTEEIEQEELANILEEVQNVYDSLDRFSSNLHGDTLTAAEYRSSNYKKIIDIASKKLEELKG